MRPASFLAYSAIAGQSLVSAAPIAVPQRATPQEHAEFWANVGAWSNSLEKAGTWIGPLSGKLLGVTPGGWIQSESLKEIFPDPKNKAMAERVIADTVENGGKTVASSIEPHTDQVARIIDEKSNDFADVIADAGDELASSLRTAATPVLATGPKKAAVLGGDGRVPDDTPRKLASDAVQVGGEITANVVNTVGTVASWPFRKAPTIVKNLAASIANEVSQPEKDANYIAL